MTNYAMERNFMHFDILTRHTPVNSKKFAAVLSFMAWKQGACVLISTKTVLVAQHCSDCHPSRYAHLDPNILTKLSALTFELSHCNGRIWWLWTLG